MAGRHKNRLDRPAVADDRAPFDQPVVLPLTDAIDLHPFQPKEIPSVVEEYIDQCAQAGLRQVRLIHGKGIGVQREIVRSLLSKHPAVLSHRDAPAEAGGWGATIVTLKPAPLKSS
jgi:dsDNA-specific endonuclease/ATPase MutS2